VRHRLTLLAAALVLLPAAARGFDQQITSTLWARGYAVPAADGSLISRRRIVEDLHLAAWNIIDGSGDPYYEGPRLAVELALTIDTDFAIGRSESDPGNPSSYVPGLTPLSMDLMFFHLDAAGLLGGALDLRVGRQVRLGTLGFFAFDGAETALHLPVAARFTTWIGYEVRGAHALGYDALELDGTDNGGRHGMEADLYPDRTEPDRRLAVGTELDWAPWRWLDAGVGLRVVGLTGPLAEQRYGARLALGRAPLRARGRVAVDPLFVRRDDTTAAAREGTLVSEADAALEVIPSERVTVAAEYHLFRPIFEADSIFNVFDLAAQNDAGARIDVVVVPGLRLAGWGFARLADGSAGLSGREDDALLAGLGGGLGGGFRGGLGDVSGRVTGVREWGETRVGAELGGSRGLVRDRLRLGLRVSAWHLGDEYSERLAGDVVGYAASVRVRVADGADVLGEFENYYGGGQAPRFAALGLLRLDLWR
jgi:hypothetical protein